MDLGAFAEEILDAVAGICGDAVVETHAQASRVLDALVRRPGANRHELAAVFGISFEQLERCRSGGAEKTKDPVYAGVCQLDAVYTWNVLIQRINQAAHWREEFREMQNAGDDDDGEGDDGDSDAGCEGNAIAAPGDSKVEGGLVAAAEGKENALAPAELVPKAGGLASAETRERARQVLAKHLDAPEALKRRLIRRLDEEVFEFCPEDKDYRHCARTIAANLRRNTMLAAGYSCGRVPPEWIVLANSEALAPRLRQLQRRALRAECLREAVLDDASAEMRRRAWVAAKGTDLAPPPPNEDPFG